MAGRLVGTPHISRSIPGSRPASPPPNGKATESGTVFWKVEEADRPPVERVGRVLLDEGDTAAASVAGGTAPITAGSGAGKTA